MVTGPSLWISTSIIAPNRPSWTSTPAERSVRHQLLHQRFGHLRWRRIGERRAPTPPRIAIERELTHHEYRSSDVGNAQVHLAVRDPERCASPASLSAIATASAAAIAAVTPTRTSSPPPDLPDHLTVHRHR